jgi:F-type H+-transporting ATPase subunit b
VEGLGINLGYLIFHILNFGIIFVVCYAWLYKPVIKMLDKRRETIARGVEDARVAAEARANAEKEAQKIIAEAQTQAAQVIRQATERAETAEKDVRSAAEKEIEKVRADALADVEMERTRIMGDMRSKVAALGIAAAQKLVGEALDEKRQHQLLEEFFSGVKDGKVVVLEGTDLQGELTEITSALPLSGTEQETIKREMAAHVHGSKEYNFKVDPAILGGLVIKVGDKRIDGSVAGQLENLKQTLK